jgi:hypothetical protein
MPRLRVQHRPTTRDTRALRNVAPTWQPSVVPAAVNANIIKVFLSWDGAVVALFDRPVVVDTDAPPTTWHFGSSFSLQPGGFNFTNGLYIIPNGAVNPGDAVVIGPDDPAARTPDGGYVNGLTTTIQDL